MFRLDIDFIVPAEKAEQEPFLLLAAIFSLPYFANQIIRTVIFLPFVEHVKQLDIAGADLFFKLAERRDDRILIQIDAALGHLPVFADHIDSPTDEHLPLFVENHHPGAGTIREAFTERRCVHLASCLLASAEIGTSRSPFASSSLAQSIKYVLLFSDG